MPKILTRGGAVEVETCGRSENIAEEEGSSEDNQLDDKGTEYLSFSSHKTGFSATGLCGSCKTGISKESGVDNRANVMTISGKLIFSRIRVWSLTHCVSPVVSPDKGFGAHLEC